MDDETLQKHYDYGKTSEVKRLKLKRIQIFALTFFAYAAVHCTRTAWSDGKDSFKVWWELKTNTFLGIMDSCFLFALSISCAVLGTMGDRMNLTYFVTFGMIGASISYCLIGLIGFSHSTTALYFLPVFMALNGVCQATQWPGLVAIMGNWFGKGGRGLLMGVWAGNANVGDIIGFALIGQLVINTFDLNWQYCILVGGVFLFFAAILNLFLLDPYPKKLGFDVDQTDASTEVKGSSEISDTHGDNLSYEKSAVSTYSDDRNKSEEQGVLQENIEGLPSVVAENGQVQNLNFFSAWFVPGVFYFAMCYFCLKSSTYGMLFWLPTYLKQKDELAHTTQLRDNSSYIASMFDLGTWAGGICTGIVSDMIGKRAIIMCPMLVISALLMFVVNFFLGLDALPYYFVIFFVGFFLGGPYNIISAAVSIDLAKQPALSGQKKAIATVSLIEGTGSFGAAILQTVIGSIDSKYIFYLFTILCFTASICLIPIVIQDVKDLLERHHRKHDQKEFLDENDENSK